MELIPLFEKTYKSVLNEAEANQRSVLAKILKYNSTTSYGQDHQFSKINTYEAFREQIPVIRYKAIEQYVERISQKEKRVLTQDPVLALARTSGTSTSNKFIPITKAFIRKNHQHASRVMLFCIKNNYGFSNYVIGKNFSLAGYYYDNHNRMKCADVSALLVDALPLLFKPFNFPNKSFKSWDEKITYIIQNWKVLENVKMISGVPTWVLSTFKELESHTGYNPARIFKSLELYIHGGVHFTPYRDTFKRLFGHQVKYLETYNATEGFFAFQDDPESSDLLLVNDAEIFFEFIPYAQDEAIAFDKIIPLWEVEKNTNYLIVITTNSGLYRYILGDTVSFSSTHPYRLIITGREQEFINAFGEDLYLHQVLEAIKATQEVVSFEIEDFFVVPRYITDTVKGCHEWYIEFRIPPPDPRLFTQVLDDQLKEKNNNYHQKRNKDRALERLKVIDLPQGSIRSFLEARGKIGGQIKLKKLHNDRKILTRFSAVPSD